jgi:hypothetical protein
MDGKNKSGVTERILLAKEKCHVSRASASKIARPFVVVDEINEPQSRDGRRDER